jgi:hypothetical protein
MLHDLVLPPPSFGTENASCLIVNREDVLDVLGIS